MTRIAAIVRLGGLSLLSTLLAGGSALAVGSPATALLHHPIDSSQPAPPTPPASPAPSTPPPSSAPAAPSEVQRQAASGVIVVSTRGDGRILVIDPEDGTTITAIDAGIGLHEIAGSADGRLAVGSAYGEGPRHQTPDKRLCVIDLTTGAVARTFDLVTAAGVEHVRPNDLVVLGDGRRALVTSEVRRAILEVDVVDGRIVREIAHGVPAAHMLAVTPDGRRAFVSSVSDAAVVAIDVASGEVVGTVPAEAGAEGIACSPDGTQVWVANNRAGSITVIDAVALEPLATIPSTGFPFRVRFTSDGRSVLVSCPQANVVRVYDAATHLLRGEIATAAAPTSLAVEPVAKSAASGKGEQETSGSSSHSEEPGQTKESSASRAATAPRACVVCAGAGSIAILNLDTLTVERTIPVGPGADGMAWVSTPAR